MLNVRQMRFVDEYMVSLNGTLAAIRAGYSGKTARTIASQNLLKPEIAAEIARRRERLNKRSDAQADLVIKELGRIAFANIKGIFSDDGKIKPPEEWPLEAWDGIKSVNYSEQFAPASSDGKKRRLRYRANIKMQDKTKALTVLAKYFGLIEARRKKPRRP